MAGLGSPCGARFTMHPIRRILLADDDLSIRAGVADLLSSLGLEVIQAGDGLEALDIVRATTIHVALLDLQMPRCHGIEALPLIHAERAGLPVLVYSGALTDATAAMAIEFGAFAALKKPVQPDFLRSEVLRALNHSPYLN
jgi:DNA-binding NtrC family response regulator